MPENFADLNYLTEQSPSCMRSSSNQARTANTWSGSQKKGVCTSFDWKLGAAALEMTMYTAVCFTRMPSTFHAPNSIAWMCRSSEPRRSRTMSPRRIYSKPQRSWHSRLRSIVGVPEVMPELAETARFLIDYVICLGCCANTGNFIVY